MPPRPSRTLSTSEIDDGWVLPDESALARPLLVTDAAPVNGTATAAADGWTLETEAPPPALLDLNAATADELVALPGIGARKATIILDRRAQRPFASVSELGELHGFGPKLVAKLAAHVRV